VRRLEPKRGGSRRDRLERIACGGRAKRCSDLVREELDIERTSELREQAECGLVARGHGIGVRRSDRHGKAQRRKMVLIPAIFGGNIPALASLWNLP
jgi:hypothetical protein